MIYKIRCSYPRNFFKLIFLGIPPSYSTLNVSFPIRRMANRTPVCQLNLKGYIILQTKVFQGKRSHFQGIYCSRSIGFSRKHHYFHKRTILPSSLHNDTEHGQLTLHNSELPECINPEFSPINFQFLKEISTFHYPPSLFATVNISTSPTLQILQKFISPDTPHTHYVGCHRFFPNWIFELEHKTFKEISMDFS